MCSVCVLPVFACVCLCFLSVKKPSNRLKTFGINGRVLGPTVGAWCEVSEDFELILDLIAHALADEETSTIQVPDGKTCEP